jgi:hypothetical protein
MLAKAANESYNVSSANAKRRRSFMSYGYKSASKYGVAGWRNGGWRRVQLAKLFMLSGSISEIMA